ncbi:hypothetical protein SELMODRAFT_417764 [Selaginella moellendorffii]|uniref:Prolyl 4-hydroxylase alpha subunit Fe(2+) 2OG dioxygenase domain-containing protein n=1 Tax=Selaginella moellendorffii TaxID=88036 RepID=D8S3J4_SELML|nr:hypothetical protein SELMODRAFT_417764 [Selaginella moellendorffii]
MVDRKALCEALTQEAAGIFACGGSIDDHLPSSISVQGIGEVALPISLDDAFRRQEAAEQAPHGLGNRTLVDTAVRRAWQIDGSKVLSYFSTATLSKPSLLLLFVAWGWIQVEAHLYKLLVYDSDGHFKLHRDTEKEPGMFATLILQLPTRHQHGNLTKTFDFDVPGFNYTAFFADCEHEVQPDANSSPEKLVFPLEQYTETNLYFSGFKGQDRMVVELYVCLMEQSKVYSDDELLTSSVSAKRWVAIDDKVVRFKNLRFNLESEPLGDFELFSDDPNSESHKAYMGNYGPEHHYWHYKITACV